MSILRYTLYLSLKSRILEILRDLEQPLQPTKQDFHLSSLLDLPTRAYLRDYGLEATRHTRQGPWSKSINLLSTAPQQEGEEQRPGKWGFHQRTPSNFHRDPQIRGSRHRGGCLPVTLPIALPVTTNRQQTPCPIGPALKFTVRLVRMASLSSVYQCLSVKLSSSNMKIIAQASVLNSSCMFSDYQ